MKENSPLLGLFFAVCINCSPLALSQQIVVLGVLEIDFPPYQYIVDGKQTGPEAELLREAFRRLPDYELYYKLLPVKRAVIELERGAIDMTMGFNTPEREKFAWFIQTPLHWSNYTISVLSGNEFPFDRIEDLYGRDIAMMRGNKISKEFDKAVSEGKINIHFVNTFEDTLKMLTSNRVKSIVGNLTVTKYYADKLGFSEKVTSLPRPINPPKPFRLMVSKNSQLPDIKKFYRQLEDELSAMLQDGTFDRIYHEHGLAFDHAQEDK